MSAAPARSLVVAQLTRKLRSNLRDCDGQTVTVSRASASTAAAVSGQRVIILIAHNGIGSLQKMIGQA